MDRDERCTIEDYGYIRRLIVSDAVPVDSGSVAAVHLGADTRRSTIHVEETPVEFVRRLERRTVVTAGEMSALTVELSHAAESVAWFFNNVEIDASNAAYRIINDGAVQALQVSARKHTESKAV